MKPCGELKKKDLSGVRSGEINDADSLQSLASAVLSKREPLAAAC